MKTKIRYTSNHTDKGEIEVNDEIAHNLVAEGVAEYVNESKNERVKDEGSTEIHPKPITKEIRKPKPHSS